MSGGAALATCPSRGMASSVSPVGGGVACSPPLAAEGPVGVGAAGAGVRVAGRVGKGVGEGRGSPMPAIQPVASSTQLKATMIRTVVFCMGISHGTNGHGAGKRQR